MKRKAFRDRLIRLFMKNEYLFFIVKYWRLRLMMVFFRNIDDRRFVEWQYTQRTGRHLNLTKPVLYNEKVQYAKLYVHDERMKPLVDKYEVRRFVRDAIGSAYLTELYGLYNNVDEIDFGGLPDQFVMKLTNGSGFNYICSHKSQEEIRKIKRRFRKWQKLDFHMLGREWAYQGVPNRIICEEYLQCLGEHGLNDYKVFCFHGEPLLIQVDFDRFTNHKRNLYSPQWQFINEKVAYDNDPNARIERPENLDDMMRCARILSSAFSHVRVDFYSIGRRLVFSEMTFYHGAGYLHFDSDAFEHELGSYWKVQDDV